MNPVDIIYRYDSEGGSVREQPADADAALQRLNEGNHAFSRLFMEDLTSSALSQKLVYVDPRDVGIFAGGAEAPAQRPFAAVLGCADARVPVSLIFNEGPNDLFVVRVAGNTLGDDVRGSLNYALEHLKDTLKLVVVLGHSGCGAVSTAVDIALNPSAYLSLVSKHALRLVVDRILVVVQAAIHRLAQKFGSDIVRHPRYREVLIEVSVITNAAVAAHVLQAQIGEAESAKVKAVFGSYSIADRLIWAPRHGSPDTHGLTSPPSSAKDFDKWSEAVLGSARIKAILGG